MNTKETAEELARLRNLATALYDENARLRARVAELEAEARWVSVENGYPTIDGECEFVYRGAVVFDGEMLCHEIDPGYTHWRYITPPEAE